MMPFSNPFRRKKANPVKEPAPSYENTNGNEPESVKPQLVFHAQLAHGSPTARIEGFSNIRELYSRIAKAFNIPVSEIIFCTLNTHKCEMDRLLGGQIGLEDFIFAHIKGQVKNISLTKSEAALGLTITDNGAGYPFLKRIKPNSVADQCKTLCVGDHVQSICGQSTVGSRHFQVAKQLKEIPLNTTFEMVLVEPQKAFDMISQRGAAKAPPVSSSNIGTGKSTLRLRSKGPATIEALPTEKEGKAVGKIDDLLDSFLGIRDMELSSTIWECGKEQKNPDDFLTALNDQLGDFAFPQEFIFDVWGVVLDTRQTY
uniref:PDZ domain-containing protein GIPC1 n=1 Tax=Phallusia mammillata TaxID=59560 RepID=A0A6F9DDJ3_9ASCI|nr:PDZ domain-containing protein GIPC1 [Phallusia mammillata]